VPAVGATNGPEVGTIALVTVSVAVPSTVPEHVPPVYIVIFTVPPAVVVAPVKPLDTVTEPP